jgi:signal transduction histidine kinase
VSSSAPDRSRAGLAWTLFAIVIASTVLGIVLAWLSRSSIPEGSDSFGDVFFLVSFQLFPVVGVLIASRRPENAVGWLLLAIGLANGLGIVTGGYASWALYAHPAAPFGAAAAAFTSWTWVPGVALPVTFLLLVFPDGHLPSRRWRWFARVLAAGMIGASIGILFAPGAIDGYPGFTNPLGVSWLTWTVAGIVLIPVGVVGAVASLVIRFRRATGDDRQQIKWIAVAASIVGFLYAFAMVMSLTTSWDNTAPQWVQVLQSVCLMSFGLLPIAIGVAVLKYRLYDLDLVIRKAVLFAVLAAFISVVYVAIVVGVGALVGAASSSALSAAAAAVVALAFQPLRRWAGRLADRLVYGSRATPYELLSEFSHRVGDTYATDDVLPRMATLVGQGIGAERAQVWLRAGTTIRVAASWPPDVDTPDPITIVAGEDLPDRFGSDVAFAVEDRGDLLGALAVSMPANDPMDPAKEALVRDLAVQAGPIVRNVALTAELQARLDDLQAAQRRLVTAQDEERRKLERNIHDGAQQQLVALTVKLRLAQGLIGKDHARAEAMLADLQIDTQGALEDLRDLARGIYPPLLADKGLPSALEAQIRKSPLPVSLHTNGVGRYPQATEAAVYFSCLEALQNVAKYAHASTARVELRQDVAELSFSVIDDGVGFDPASTHYGTGLQGIADRLGAIEGTVQVTSSPGAGARVVGRIPIAVRGDEPADAAVRPQGVPV